MNVKDLLFNQEVNGLRTIFYFRIFFIITALIMSFPASQSLTEKILVSLATLVFLSYCIISIIFFINKKRFVKTLGVIGAFMDLVILASFPFIWYYAVGGEPVLKSYLVKSQTLITIQAAILIINIFASKPLYPLIITFGTVITNYGLLLYAYPDIAPIMTSHFEEHITGSKFSIALYNIFNTAFFLSGLCASYLAMKNSKSIKDAIILQAKTDSFSRYFSPNIVKEFDKIDRNILESKGSKQNVAVMFCDLRNFTGLSENMTPEQVVEMLSEYHDKMVSVIFKHGGTLDKFIGDAIMATFGTPYTKDDDVKRSVQCALEMKDKLNELNKQRILSGKTALDNGIGIHYGEVIAGNIGSRERVEYTVIGDTVNIASRIESVCKKYEKGLLFSGEVYEIIKSSNPLNFKFVAEEMLKGKTKPVQLYTVE